MSSLTDDTKNIFNTYSESYLQNQDDLQFAGWDEDSNPFWTDSDGNKYYESSGSQQNATGGGDSGTDDGSGAGNGGGNAPAYNYNSGYCPGNYGAGSYGPQNVGMGNYGPPVNPYGPVVNPSGVLTSWPGSQNNIFGGAATYNGSMPGANDIPQTAGPDKYSQQSIQLLALSNDRVQQAINSGMAVVMSRDNVVGGNPVQKSVVLSPGNPGAGIYTVGFTGPLNTDGTLIPNQAIQYTYPALPGTSDSTDVESTGGGGGASGSGSGDCDCGGGGGTGGASGGSGGASGGGGTGGPSGGTGSDTTGTGTGKDTTPSVVDTTKTTAVNQVAKVSQNRVTDKKNATNAVANPQYKWTGPDHNNNQIPAPVHTYGVTPVPKKVVDQNKQESGKSNFDEAIKIVLKHEGGWKDQPKKDKGDPTNMGISWPTWQEYAEPLLGVKPTYENLQKLSVEQATKIYKDVYWKPKGFDKFKDAGLGVQIYDWTITSGGAVKEIQKLLNNEFGQKLDEDGGLGAKTIDAINRVDQNKLYNRIQDIRKLYYKKGLDQGWYSPDYYDGLINRANDFKKRKT